MQYSRDVVTPYSQNTAKTALPGISRTNIGMTAVGADYAFPLPSNVRKLKEEN